MVLLAATSACSGRSERDAAGDDLVADEGDDDDDTSGIEVEDPVDGDIDQSLDSCSSIHATIRDFSLAHPDFETYENDFATPGIVKPNLDADRKPIYAHSGATSQTTSRADFEQWYHDIKGVNQRFEIELVLKRVGTNVCSFSDSTFFPIDGLGFGSEGLVASDGLEHNFLFTTEIHTSFVYRTGQVFTFVGDDDLWMFIDGKLAIDLGGLHPALEQSVNLDDLGLEVGKTYGMEIFHAERHTTDSNFRIDTNIEFIPPE
jgi:fibro-slime domain-containing protein